MAEYRKEKYSTPAVKCSEIDSTADDVENRENTKKIIEEKGWWKWMVLLGCVLINFINEGAFSSFGVLYTALWEYFGGSKGHISLIGSLNFSLPLLGGALASLIAGKFGCRFAAILGSLVASAGIIASVFSTTVVHLYISFGFVAGLATSLPYIASVLILSQYFDQRLGFVNGVAECGACIGTIVLPVTLETMLTDYGWRGTLLIMAGLNLNIVVCGSLFTEKRKVQNTVSVEKLSDEITPVKDDRQTNEDKTTFTGIDNSGFSLEVDNGIKHCSKGGEPSKHENILTNDEIGSGISNRNMSPMKDFCSDVTKEIKHHDEEQEAHSDVHESRINISSGVIEREELQSTIIGLPDKKSDVPSEKPASMGSEVNSNETIEEESGEQKARTIVDSLEEGNPLSTEPADMSWCVTCCTTLRLDIFKNTHFVTYIMFIFMLHIFIDIPYVYLPDRGIDVGLSRQHSTLLLTTLGVMQLVGNLLFGYVGDIKRIDNVFVFGCCIVLSGTSLALIPFTQEFTPLAVCAGAFGFFTATAESMCSVMVVEFLGLNTLSTGYGYTMMVKGVALLIGPPFGGWLHDITGDYDLTFYVAGGCLGVCGVLYTFASKLAAVLERRRRKQ